MESESEKSAAGVPPASPSAETEEQRMQFVRDAFRPAIDARSEFQRLPFGVPCPRMLLVAISAACLAVLRGKERFPQAFASAWQTCINLGMKCVDCLRGDRLAITEVGNPHPRFWTEFDGILAVLNKPAKKKLTGAQQRFIDLYEQFEGDPRRDDYIARDFGRYKDGEWIGPFHYRGAVQTQWIQQEYQKSGSRLSDDHDQFREDGTAVVELAPIPVRLIRSLEEALAEEARNFGDEDDRPLAEDPATIEDLLRQGQNPDVIAKVKRVTLEQVLHVAERIGVKPRFASENFGPANILSADDQIYSRSILSQDGPVGSQESKSREAAPSSSPSAEQQPEQSEKTSEESPESSGGLKAIDGADLDAALGEMVDRNPDTTTPEAMRELKRRGFTASGAAVGRRLTTIRANNRS